MHIAHEKAIRQCLNITEPVDGEDGKLVRVPIPENIKNIVEIAENLQTTGSSWKSFSKSDIILLMTVIKYLESIQVKDSEPEEEKRKPGRPKKDE